MGFFDSIDAFIGGSPMRAKIAQAQLDEAQARLSKTGLLEASDARAQLLGTQGPDGTQYQPPQAPQTIQNGPMGDPTQNMGPQGLLGPRMQYAQSMTTPGLLGNRPVDQGEFDRGQQALMVKADPAEAMKIMQGTQSLQRSLGIIGNSGLPPDVQQAMAVSLISPKVGESLSKNLEMPDQLKSVKSLLTGLNSATPGSQAYNAYSSMLTNATQNIEGMKLAEEIRNHKALENNGNLDVQTDPTTGQLAIVDKRGGKIIPLQGSAPQLPPIEPPGMPATGVPAPGIQTPQTGPQGAPPAPQPPNAAAANGPATPDAGPIIPTPDVSPANDFTPQLPQQTEARIQMLPQFQRSYVRSILTGRAPPPTGRALSDPVLRPMFLAAQQVDPSFDETQWGARNKMITGMADTKNDSMGGRIDSAKKLINHTFDAVSDGADLGEDAMLGKAGNFIGNTTSDFFGTGKQNSNLGSYGEAVEGVATEKHKLMSGAQGGEGSADREIKLLSPNNPLGSKIGAMGRIMEQMGGQVNPLVDQYNGVMKTNVSLEQMLGPDASNKLKAIQTLAAAAKAGTKITPALVKSTLAALNKAPPNGGPPQDAKGASLKAAKAAIAAGVPRNVVIQRLRDNGVDPTGI